MCEQKWKRSFHTATFTSWCVKMQHTFSHYNFYSLGVEKNRPSPWSHARGTSGKGLPKKNPTQQTKFFFFGGEMNRSFCKIITDLSSQQICNWALILKNTLRGDFSHQQSVECFCWRSGVCCWGPNSVFEIVATHTCCKQLENPKLTALFVCLFLWLNLHQEPAVLL